MKNRFELLNTLWLNELLINPQVEPYLVFGPTPQRGFNPLLSIESEITQLSSLQGSLKKLFKKYKVNIESPEPLDGYPFINPGKIGYTGAHAGIHMWSEISGRLNELKRNAKAIRENNSLKEKRGPSSTPSFFDEHILVGLRLHEKSKRDLAFFRRFIEPGGGLDKCFQSKSIHPRALEVLITSTGDEDILRWKKQKQLSLERKLLSRKLNRDIKAFSKYPHDLAEIRAKISAAAKRIVIQADLS